MTNRTQTTSLWPGRNPDSGRCQTCDCRYCGEFCEAVEDTRYVVGIGWRLIHEAIALQNNGATVHWGEKGWLPPRDSGLSVARLPHTASFGLD